VVVVKKKPLTLKRSKQDEDKREIGISKKKELNSRKPLSCLEKSHGVAESTDVGKKRFPGGGGGRIVVKRNPGPEGEDSKVSTQLRKKRCFGSIRNLGAIGKSQKHWRETGVRRGASQDKTS